MPLVKYDDVLSNATTTTVSEIEESLQEAQRLFALLLMVFYIIFVFLVLGAVGLGIYVCIERIIDNRRLQRDAKMYGDPMGRRAPKRVMVGKWFYKQSDSASTEELNSEEAYELMAAEGLIVPEETHTRRPRGTIVDPPESRSVGYVPRQQGFVAAYVTDEDPDLTDKLHSPLLTSNIP